MMGFSMPLGLGTHLLGVLACLCTAASSFTPWSFPLPLA
jgi:hypothetical protein